MSPEQWEGKALEPAGDQWALAVVGWELLTGTPPFHGDENQLGFLNSTTQTSRRRSLGSGNKRHREYKQDSHPDNAQCMPEPFRERHAPEIFMVVSISEG